MGKLRLAAKIKQDEEQEEKADTPAWAQQSVSTVDLNEVRDKLKNDNSILFHGVNNEYVLKEEDIEMVTLEFTAQTTTQEAIKQIWSKICKNSSHDIKLQFQLLDLECFVLKTCGREE